MKCFNYLMILSKQNDRAPHCDFKTDTMATSREQVVYSCWATSCIGVLVVHQLEPSLSQDKKCSLENT